MSKKNVLNIGIVCGEHSGDRIGAGLIEELKKNYTVNLYGVGGPKLEKLGLKDGESIDHPWINKALERAQQKVEARNFDIRKTLLKFDNVLNDQRQVIFSQRKKVLSTKDIYIFVNTYLIRK